MTWYPDLPVPGDAVKCGHRTDVGKKLRRHLWWNLGADSRHMGDGTQLDMRVLVCVRCGTDQYVSLDRDGPWMRQAQ